MLIDAAQMRQRSPWPSLSSNYEASLTIQPPPANRSAKLTQRK